MPEEKTKPSIPPKKRSRFKYIFGCCSLIFVLIIIIATIAGALTVTGYTKEWICDAVVEDSYIWDSVDCQKSQEVKTSDSQELSDELRDLLQSEDVDDRVSGIVELSQSSVVGIGVQGQGLNEQILGTGFIVTEDGWIVTNQHVVSTTSAEYFVQTSDGNVLDVQEVYRDPVNDIAVIKVQTDGLNALPLGDSQDLQVGQTVIAIGNPLGELSGTVTKGIISGLGRTVEVSSGGFFNSSVDTFEGVIQTDAAINPGNSGGPLINLQGEVIGINFATINGADNLSFALPINRIKMRLDEIQEYGEFRMPYLGVEYVSRMVFLNGNSLVAAQIRAVEPDGPAAESGLEVGDYIVGYDGEDLSQTSLLELIQNSDVGEKVELQIVRNGEEMELEVSIGVRGGDK